MLEEERRKAGKEDVRGPENNGCVDTGQHGQRYG